MNPSVVLTESTISEKLPALVHQRERVNSCLLPDRADWLVTLIFASISLFAESSARAVAVLCIFSLAATAAIFLILELSQPFTGLMRISDQQWRNALPAMATLSAMLPVFRWVFLTLIQTEILPVYMVSLERMLNCYHPSLVDIAPRGCRACQLGLRMCSASNTDRIQLPST